MRMMDEGLAPGVEDGEEADLGAEVARVGGYRAERVGDGPEQETVDDGLVLDGDLHVAALFLAAEGGRGRQQVRGQAGEEAPGDVGRGEEGGIGAHDRLLGRTEEEGGQEVARPAHRGPAWDESRLT